jgi:hydrogenase maturation factor
MSGRFTAERCITCGEEAIPMRVIELVPGSLALCRRPDGRRETVETALVEPVAAGELLLVHAGTALARAREWETPA